MNIKFLYPEAKTKAFTLSYDDGQVMDRRLVALFNKYGLKATFHLNSGVVDEVGFVTHEELRGLYAGHEVACHGKSHAYLGQLTKEQLIKEIWDDRRNLENWMCDIVNGMSYAFGAYSDQIVKALSNMGIQYSRTVSSTHGFSWPDDFMKWHPTCHHRDEHLLEICDLFLNAPNYMSLPLFYVWGHSFEFKEEAQWEAMEEFCEKVAHKEEVWYATNGQIKTYICALRNIIFSAESNRCYNPSGSKVWLNVDGKTYILEPGCKIELA